MPAATPIANGADPTPAALAGQTPSELAFSEGVDADSPLKFARPNIPSPTETLKSVNDDPKSNLIEQNDPTETESATDVGDPDSSIVGAIAGVGGIAVLGAAGAALFIRRRQVATETENAFEQQKQPDATPK